ncbi:hypothetical protein VNO77_27225 [Canavalia gladiata]|uniref:Serine protease n=1 Tax=Canavalia gladiata TaxID=3824 RepID=A0AAN9Q6X4_CANGL
MRYHGRARGAKIIIVANDPFSLTEYAMKPRTPMIYGATKPSFFETVIKEESRDVIVRIIFDGIFARLDKDAPHYERDSHNDSSTFNMQVVSRTKGGSSSSPVIDWQGRAVAVNTGSKSSNESASFLPLRRVEKTSWHIHKGK